MKRKIIIVMTMPMNLGGIERSLIGLLDHLDYNLFEVDLLLYGHHGALFPKIPKEVNLLPEIKNLSMNIDSLYAKLRYGAFYSAWTRIKQFFLKFDYYEFDKQITNYSVLPSFRHYDLALGFFLPFNILKDKISATVKIGWVHTDYTRAPKNINSLREQYNGLDYIAAVSEKCKESFTTVFPEYRDKTIVIENMLPADLSFSHSDMESAEKDMPDDGSIKILSIGRFAPAKNFTNVPDICQRVIEHGLNVKWYLLGYGEEEKKIRQEIKRLHLQDRVVILGKRDNPYAYIKRCDLYVQPSVFEGKAVTVCEAQALCKPVVITNYPTASSQVINGKNGIIVPLENKACAAGIAELLKNQQRLTALSDYCREQKDTLCNEIEKIYSLLSTAK